MTTNLELRDKPTMHADPFERLRAENRDLRARNLELFNKYADATLALGLATGHFPPFNEVTLKRAQELLASRKAEWESRDLGQ